MSNDSDDVGYRKPPKKHQFPKGKSGNPSGRPKDSSDFHAVIGKLLSERQKTKNGEILSNREIYVVSLLKDAADGKPGSFNEFIKLLKRSKIVTPPAPPPRPPVGVDTEQMTMEEWNRNFGRRSDDPSKK